MASDQARLHILFFPFMAQGHMLPMLDMARLFASRGVKATVLTTPANAPLLQPAIDRANRSSGHQNPIQLRLIPFPSGTGLPEGCENLSFVPRHLMPNFLDAVGLLRQPFYHLLRDVCPDCVVTAGFLHWTYDVATELGIPRLVFYGSNFFSRCISDSLDRHNPLENMVEGAVNCLVIIPDLPHRIEMLRSQIPDLKKTAHFMVDLFAQAKEVESKSYGVVVNSFYELEPDYVQHYKHVVGRKAWHIGPVSLCNQDTGDKSVRGNMTTMAYDTCLKWLDGKMPGSVVYVCFGSVSEFTVDQLRELALGLQASGCPFIWVVRDGGEESIPEGFEERVQGRGLVLRGWAPQILILNHKAIGGFVTHCGWNSSLEGISAGLPLITWPLFAEQFYNERLIVEILKTGIAIGAKNYALQPEERPVVEAVTIEKAVNELMSEGKESRERRRRAKELGDLAKRAVESGGSSHVDLSNLIQELKEIR